MFKIGDAVLYDGKDPGSEVPSQQAVVHSIDKNYVDIEVTVNSQARKVPSFTQSVKSRHLKLLDSNPDILRIENIHRQLGETYREFRVANAKITIAWDQEA